MPHLGLLRKHYHLRRDSRNVSNHKYMTHNPSEDYEYENPRRGPSPRQPPTDTYRRSSSNRDSKMFVRNYQGRDERDFYRGPAAADPYVDSGQVPRRESWKVSGPSSISPGRQGPTPLASAGQAVLSGAGAASHRNTEIYR